MGTQHEDTSNIDNEKPTHSKQGIKRTRKTVKVRVNQIQSKTGRKITIKGESKKKAMKQSMVCLSCYASVKIHQDDSTVSL